MGKLLYAVITPHPPVLIPQIGAEKLKQVEVTKKSLELISKKVKNLKPDTVVLITPHAEISKTTIKIHASHIFEGDFGELGFPKIKLSSKGDASLASLIMKETKNSKILTTEVLQSTMDHGTMVPLHYLKSAGVKSKILPVAIAYLTLKELFEFGQLLASAIEKSDGNVVVIASADMSHKLNEVAGQEFDKKLSEMISTNDVEGILTFDNDLLESARQDAIWSIAILLGAVSKFKYESKLLSYEGPFGVGYMVAEYDMEQSGSRKEKK